MIAGHWRLCFREADDQETLLVKLAVDDVVLGLLGFGVVMQFGVQPLANKWRNAPLLAADLCVF